MTSRKLTLAVACAATAMLMLDTAVVNTALTPIARDLHASSGGLKWLVDAYTVALAAAVLTAGSLADRFGRRRALGCGLAVFTGASAMCAGAGSILVLDAARAVQGLGAAVMFAVSLAVLADAYPGKEERRGALAVYGATIGASFAVGPLAGGLLASGLGWRWIFLVNVPLGLACLAANRRWVRESRDPAAPPVDVPGQVLLGAGLLLLVFGLLRGNDAGWTSAGIVGALAGGIACLGGFVAVERRVPVPMVPLSLFRRPAFAAAQVVAFGVSASAFAGYLFLTLYLQQVVGLSPVQTGLTYVPATLVSFLVAGSTAAIGQRVPARTLVVTGLLLVGAGLLVIADTTAADSGRWAMLPGLLVAMAGVGLINPVVSDLALGSVEDAQSGLAAGTLDTFRQAGLAIGVAGLGALIPDGGTPGRFVAGLHTALIVAGALTLAAAIATAALLGRRRGVAVAVATGAVALSAAVPSADAAPPFRAKRMVVAFDVHAIQVTDWRMWEETASGWTHASGTQTLGWDDRRPYRTDITAYTRQHGVDLPPLVIAAQPSRARLHAHRTGSWVDHANGGCDSEGGCPDAGASPRDTRRPLHCPDRTLRTTLGVSDDMHRLSVAFGEHDLPIWPDCQPGLSTDAAPRVELPHGVRAIQRLRRGQVITLKASVEGGTDTGTKLKRCPARLTGVGDKECTVTEVVVRARRLR